MNIGPLTVATGSTATPVPTSAAGASRTKGADAASARGAASPQPGTVLDRLFGAGAPGAPRRAEELGALLARFVRSAVSGSSGTSTASTTSASKSSASGGSLAFLKDTRLPVEERLARLMVYLSDKYEKQLEQKLQQYGNLEAGKATGSAGKSAASSSTSATKDGLSALFSKAGLGKLVSGGSVQKLLGQVAGPVLAGAATALGMPGLAPSILKAGPLLGSLATGAITVLSDGAGSAASSGKGTSSKGTSSKGTSSKGSSTSGSAGGASSETSEKQLMTEIQILQEKQKEMFTLVSNILRSQHDTKMAVISNMR